MIYRLNICILFVIIFISCSSGKSTENKEQSSTQTKKLYDTLLVKGKVIDSVLCIGNNIQSYAMYLPSNYTTEKKYPCMYFFDSHGNGAYPLKLYKNFAEQYGIVFIGSNNSKNGLQWQETSQIINSILQDTRTRINLDPNLIFAAGFSGGAKVASSMALTFGGVAGVVCCAACLPNVTDQNGQNKFDYFGIVGYYDFNFTDFEIMDERLEQNGFNKLLLKFDGKHEWAKPDEFKTALLWMQVNAIKRNLKSKNDSLINELKAEFDKHISKLEETKDWVDEMNLLTGAIKALDGLIDVSSYKKQVSVIMANAEFKTKKQDYYGLLTFETDFQQQLVKQFTQQNAQWQKSKINELVHICQINKNKPEGYVYRRLINYVGYISYMNVNRALNTGDLQNAIAFLDVFKIADPENPDCYYLESIYYLKIGNKEKAVNSLEQMAKLGYKDVTQLTTNPLFTDILNQPDLKNIILQVRENAQNVGK